MRFSGTAPAGVVTEAGGYQTIFDPAAPELGPRPRDYASKQGAQRANALRRQQMDFLLSSNRVPGVGGQFNPTAATGFQIESNKPLVAPMNVGKQLSDINPAPMSWADILAGKIPPTVKQLPGSPLFANVPNQGMGFLIPANRPKALTTGGGLPPTKA